MIQILLINKNIIGQVNKFNIVVKSILNGNVIKKAKCPLYLTYLHKHLFLQTNQLKYKKNKSKFFYNLIIRNIIYDDGSSFESDK